MTLRPTRLYHWLCAALAAAALVALTTGSALAQHGSWGAPGRPEARADDGIRIAVVPATRTPFVGEVVDVEVLVTASGSQGGQVMGTPQWADPDGQPGVVTDGWSEAERTTTNGKPAIRFRTHVVATAPGTSTLPRMTQELRVRSERSPFGDAFKDSFFGSRFADRFFDEAFANLGTQTVTIGSDPVSLDARPLPRPAPAGFTGAVGQFTLDSQLTPTSPRAGDPVTWTLTLRGSGNWPAGITVPSRSVPQGMRTLKPKTRTEFTDQARFVGSVSEDLVVIPEHAGPLHLAPVRFVYFDPDKGSYVTLEAQVPALDVQPGAQAPLAQAVVAPAPAPVAERQAADDAAALRLPREPRAGAALALVPLPRMWFAGAMATPVLLLVGYWLWLGSQRARAADPLRERREAAVALGRAVDAVRTATSGATRVEALLTWQGAAACALGLPMRAPTAAVVQSASLHVSATAAGEWADLWAQSEHAVHAPNGGLPYDWCERAAWVARQTGIPRFNVLRGLLPQRLFAAGVAAALFTCVVWAGPAAAGPLADYRAGNFAAARDAWQQRGAAAPTDWIARYNLGLAETQLGDAGRGLADTSAAFVQHPGDADVRWNLGTFVEALPGADPRLAVLARGAGVAGVVRVLSPAASQGAMIAGVVALAGGLALALWRRQRDQHGRPWHALAAAIPGVGLILIGALALRAYGPLADPAVAVVAARTELRSVPTAAAQAQRPIDAGALVTVGKQFLDWVQVRRPDGEVGWLREADLVPIYAAGAGEVDGTAKASPGAGAEGREARDG